MTGTILAVVLAGAPSDLADATEVVPGLKLELRYATEDNFLKRKVYPVARCLLRREVAERLGRVQARLARDGLGLRVFDCYRPLAIQKEMWKLVPLEGYVANPAKGSNHNRGAAVDLTLVDAKGEPLPMPTGFDAFVPAAHHGAKVEPERARNRERLKAAMEAEGFRPNRMEWWHYDAPGAAKLPVLDVPLDEAQTGGTLNPAGPPSPTGKGDGG